jgi:hypothetical protein
MTTQHDFGGVLGRRPLDTFFGALTISWSRLLARVWSGPKSCKGMTTYIVYVHGRNSKHVGEVNWWDGR